MSVMQDFTETSSEIIKLSNSFKIEISDYKII